MFFRIKYFFLAKWSFSSVCSLFDAKNQSLKWCNILRQNDLHPQDEFLFTSRGILFLVTPNYLIHYFDKNRIWNWLSQDFFFFALWTVGLKQRILFWYFQIWILLWNFGGSKMYGKSRKLDIFFNENWHRGDTPRSKLCQFVGTFNTF